MINHPYPVQTSPTTVFVHSMLDDFGLSTSEFRVFCHLARRANKSGKAQPGHESMAKICKLEIKTVRKAIATLEHRRMIRVESRPGETNLYVLLPPDLWRAEDTEEPPRTAPPPNPHPGWKTDRHVGCQTEGGGIQSAPDEGYPAKRIQKKTHTQEAVCAPAASFSSGQDQSKGHPNPEEKAVLKAAELQKRFDIFWEALCPEYRGDKLPAWQEILALELTAEQFEEMATHRQQWESRARSAESGETGWVAKPKQVANYLRVKQFETLLPEPKPLRSVAKANFEAPLRQETSETEQLAELKRLGIVGLDLLNGRAELEDDYAFAVDLVGTHRYSDILAHKDRLLEIHQSKQSQ